MSAGSGHGRLWRLLLILVLLLSVLLQATVVSRTKVNSPLRVDAQDYFSYARNLQAHGVYSLQPTWQDEDAGPPAPDAVRTPGYPLFLIAFDPQPTWAWFRKLGYGQGVLSVLSVLLVYLIGRRFLSPPWSTFAAGLTAVSPALVVMSTYVLSEVLFTFLLLAALLASVKAMESRDWRRALFAGLLWGAASLVRPTSQFVPALALLACLLVSSLRPLLGCALACLLGFALVLAPWVIRNQGLPTPPPGNSLMVKAIAHGAYPGFMYDNQANSYGYPYRSDPEAAAHARDLPSVLRFITDGFREHPMRYLSWYLVGKPIAFLSWRDPQARDIFIYPADRSPYFESAPLFLSWRLMSLLHWPLTLLGLCAGALAIARTRSAMVSSPSNESAAVVAWLLAYAIGFHMLVAPFPRYNLPFRPLVYLLAALMLQELWRRWRGGRGATPATATAAHAGSIADDGAYVGTELEVFAGARRWKAYWSSRLQPAIRGRVLDVGAGLGASARLFAGSPGITSYVALEPDRALAQRIRATADEGGLPPGFSVEVGTTEGLAAAPAYDTILYIDVLEHIAADREELARAAALLAPGGRILVLAPAHQSLYSPFDAAVGHVRRYDRDSLRQAVPDTLEIERMYYLDSVGWLASLGNKLVLRASQPSASQIALWDGAMVPLSRLLDPLLGFRFGKTIVAQLRRSGE